MADAPQTLSLADQVLVNCLGALTAHVVHEPVRSQMMIDLVREVLPHVTGSNPVVAKLIPAAAAFLAPVLGSDARCGFASARLKAAGPMTDFFEWRAAMAVTAWRAKHAEAAQ